MEAAAHCPVQLLPLGKTGLEIVSVWTCLASGDFLQCPTALLLQSGRDPLDHPKRLPCGSIDSPPSCFLRSLHLSSSVHSTPPPCSS